MPRTNINTILKDGAATKIKTVDYSSPEKKRELQNLKAKSEAILKNKFVDPHKLSKIFINI